MSLFEALLRKDCLLANADGVELTLQGGRWLATLGFSSPAPLPRRRYACRCLDGSERRDHLAGQLAHDVLTHFIARGWLRRASSRAVEVTARGQRDLLPLL